MRKDQLVIASSLTPQQNAYLLAHPSHPKVIPVPTPWEIPEEAEILCTYQMQWRAAPAARPEKWPGGLKWIQVASSGLDVFPAWFFDGPRITREAGVQAPTIAEYVIAAILAHEKRFWDIRVSAHADWCDRQLGGIDGKMVGLVGMGAIGSEIAKRALPLGLQIKALTRARAVETDSIQQANSLSEIFETCDHVVLALPLTSLTYRIVNREVLAASRPHVHLINVSRGAIIDDVALLQALNEFRIAAATLDVTSPEPLPDGHPYYEHPRIRLTPHVSGQSENLENRLSAMIRDNIDRYLAGNTLRGIINADIQY